METIYPLKKKNKDLIYWFENMFLLIDNTTLIDHHKLQLTILMVRSTITLVLFRLSTNLAHAEIVKPLLTIRQV